MTEKPLPIDIEAIQNRARTGERFEFLFFWGHRPSKDGSIAKSCLSQWYLSPFVVEGHVYQTAEHWMMAEKARLFGDDRAVRAILRTSDPAITKALGRQVRNFDSQIWADRCREIVKRGNIQKFQQHPPLRDYLLASSGKVIAEASPDDQIWGIGLVESDTRAIDPTQWRGTNLLGFVLMEVRSALMSLSA